MNHFTKTHTQITKGITILMMLFHHLFIIPERLHYDFLSLLDKIIPNAQIAIAIFCKLCVCIYVFLSGYGIYHSLKNKATLLAMYKDICIRFIKFWTTFIVVYLLFIPIGMFFNVFSTNWKHFVLGLFGLELGFFNNTWWFINAYIILLFVAPLFIYFFSKNHWLKRIAIISILPIAYILGRVYIYVFGSNLILNTYFWYLENYPLILSLLVGVLCARFEIYEKVLSIFDKIQNEKKRRTIRIISMFMILILSIFFRVATVRNIVDMRFDFIIAPLFVFSTATILYDIKHNHFFLLCGNHSTTIWLTHAFLCYTYAQELVLLPYYSELVFIWFIALSLITSYLTNIFLVPINNLLYSKSHKLSFNGYFTFFKAQKKDSLD